MAIRDSWGNLDHYNLENAIQIVFLLGKPANSTKEDSISAEAEKFDDIVQGDYLDTYRNLTLKALNGMEYRKIYCNQPKYVLAIDDDTFVNIPNMLVHLDRFANGQDFIECSERTVVKGPSFKIFHLLKILRNKYNITAPINNRTYAQKSFQERFGELDNGLLIKICILLRSIRHTVTDLVISCQALQPAVYTIRLR